MKNIDKAIKIRAKLIIMVPKYDQRAKALGEPSYINTIGEEKWAFTSVGENQNKKETTKEKDWFRAQMEVAKATKTKGIVIQQKAIKARNQAQMKNNNILRQKNQNGGRTANKHGLIPIGGANSMDTLVRGSTLPAEPNGTGLSKKNQQSLKNVIGHRESSNNYKAENKWGYLGKYQFGAQALEQMKLLKKGRAGGVSNNKRALASIDNWVTSYSRERFLNDPELQEQTMDNWMNYIAKSLPNSVRQKGQGHIAGMIMVAHLGGVGTAKKFIRTGADFKDANGTSIIEYYNLGAASTLGNDVAVDPSRSNPSSSYSPKSSSGSGGAGGTGGNGGAGGSSSVSYRTGQNGPTVGNANYNIESYQGPQDPSTVNIDEVMIIGGRAGRPGFEKLQPQFKNNVILMAAEFKAQTGQKLIISSAYRDPQHQWELFERALRRYGTIARARQNVAPAPGQVAGAKGSFHNKGLAIDVDISGRQGDVLHRTGLMKKYKMWRPLNNERWHIEPMETKSMRGRGSSKDAGESDSKTTSQPSAQFISPTGSTGVSSMAQAVQTGASPLSGLLSNYASMASIGTQLKGLNTQVSQLQLSKDTSGHNPTDRIQTNTNTLAASAVLT